MFVSSVEMKGYEIDENQTITHILKFKKNMLGSLGLPRPYPRGISPPPMYLPEIVPVHYLQYGSTSQQQQTKHLQIKQSHLNYFSLRYINISLVSIQVFHTKLFVTKWNQQYFDQGARTPSLNKVHGY